MRGRGVAGVGLLCALICAASPRAALAQQAPSCDDCRKDPHRAGCASLACDQLSAGGNTCEYAHDGQCDEKERRGTGFCNAGTDTYDCDDCQEFRNERGIEDDCEAVRKYQQQHPSDPVVFVLSLIILLLCCCYPCIVFGFAWLWCIRPRKLDGQQPTQNAWAVCMSVLIFVVYFLPMFTPLFFAYCFGPCLMIIPFTMDDFYCDCPGGPRGDARSRSAPRRVGRVAPSASSNPVYGGVQPVTVMAVPVQAQPVVTAQAVTVAQLHQPQVQAMERDPTQAATMATPSTPQVVVATVVQDDI